MKNDFWEKNAKSWQQTVDDVAIKSRTVTTPAILKALCSSKIGSILDLGCGEGWLGRELKEKEGFTNYLGVDGSSELIKIAKSKSNLDFLAVDYSNLASLPAKKFDKVVFNYSLLEKNIEETLVSASDYLSENGQLFIQTVHPLSNGPQPDQWKDEDFKKTSVSYDGQMKWYSRSLESWFKIFKECKFVVTNLEEVYFNDKPCSVIFKLDKLKSPVSHITLSSNNLDASIKFYKDFLGFEELSKNPEQNCHLLKNGLWLVLVHDSNSSPTNDYTHFALYFSDSELDQFEEEMKKSELDIWQENTSIGRSIYVKDPSGHKIELTSGTWKDRFAMNIKLRPPKLEDIHSYHEVFSDEETHHFIIDEGKQDLNGSTKKLNKLIEINGDKKKIYTITSGNTPAGFIVIHLDETSTPFISYAVRRSYWRKGVGVNALKSLIQLEKNNFAGFQAATHIENKASQSLLEKCGFTNHGVKDLNMGKRFLFDYNFNEEQM